MHAPSLRRHVDYKPAQVVRPCDALAAVRESWGRRQSLAMAASEQKTTFRHLSYSHAADGKLALQSALHRFAKPWYSRCATKMFCEKSSLSFSPYLWPSIESALGYSEFCLLLTSQIAARDGTDQQSNWEEGAVTWTMNTMCF